MELGAASVYLCHISIIKNENIGNSGRLLGARGFPVHKRRVVLLRTALRAITHNPDSLGNILAYLMMV